MKSTIARAILQKGFFLWDYGTYSKSVSGEREALLKKLIFFLNRPSIHIIACNDNRFTLIKSFRKKAIKLETLFDDHYPLIR